MINAIFLILEMLAVLQILYSFNGAKIRINKKLIILLLADVSIFLSVFYKILDERIQVIIYIAFFVYVFTEFKTPLIHQVMYVIFTFIIVMVIQITFNYWFFGIKIYWLKYFMINGLLLLSVIFLTRVLDLSKIGSFIGEKKQLIIGICVELAVICVVTLTVYKINNRFSLLECILVSVLAVFLTIFIVNWYNEKKILMAKEREIKLLSLCNDSFENLLNEVRARQHHSMHYVYDTYEELVKHQLEYSQGIENSNRHNDLLTAKALPVLIGYLYYKIQLIEKDGIKVDYEISLPDVKDLKINFDIIDIIGILLDNAYEAMQNSDIENPKIYMKLKSFDGFISTEIRNTSLYIKQEKIKNFFKKGYSSKGEGRGLGLYKLKKIVDFYNGDILVENSVIDEEQWFSIAINILEPERK